MKRIYTIATSVVAVVLLSMLAWMFSGYATVYMPTIAAAEKDAAPANEPVDAHGHEAAAEGGAHTGEAHADEIVLTEDAIQQNGIRVEPAQKQALTDGIVAPGRISYNLERMAHIGTPVQGRVAEIPAKLGDSFKQGDVLMVVDSPALGEAQSDFLQKRTQAEVAASAVEVAKTSADRAKRLYEGKGISLGELQRREGDYKAAEGARKAAQSALDAAENTLRLYGISEDDLKKLAASGEVHPRYAVRAPMDGHVVQREVTLGEIAGPDRDALLTLADMTTLWVLTDVPEKQIPRIAPGAAAEITVEALGDRVFPGTVAYIAPELDKETRTAQVRVTMTDPDPAIRPGMFARVHLSVTPGVETSSTGIAVPEAAVQIFEGGPVVFVAEANEPGAFVARRIEVGPSNGFFVPILSGLEEGTPVAVDGAFVIKAEMSKGIMEGKTCSGH